MTMFDRPVQRPRGRPPKSGVPGQARELIVRAGTAAFSEKGYASISLDEVLSQAGVPKGSFYYYFKSKDAFGLAVLEAYTHYFTRKIEFWFNDAASEPLQRILNFAADAKAGMARYGFRRGCVVGNLAQDMSALSPEFRDKLTAIFKTWQNLLERVLRLAQGRGQISAKA